MLLLLLSVVAFGNGCIPPPAAKISAPAAQVAGDAFMTHRAVLTIHGREFALTGYLAISETQGLRLVVSEQIGGQLADVLVKPDGSIRIVKMGPMLRREWVEKYVASDLKCLFGRTEKNCPVTVLGTNRFVVKRRWYRLDLRIVETRPGPQPASLFEAVSQ